MMDKKKQITLDMAMQGAPCTPEELLKLAKPPRSEMVLRFFEYCLGVIFPWMAPDPY